MPTHRAYITLLSLCVLAGVIYCTAPEGYSLIHNKTLIVPANVEWINSGLNISDGDYLAISASGAWGYDPRPQFLKGPDGSAEGPGLQQGRLSAKIGDGPEFAAGSYYEGMSPSDGLLMLHMYDTTQRHDNIGNVSVNVLVYSKETQNLGGPSDEKGTPEVQEEVRTERETEPPVNNTELCTAGLVFLMALLALYAYQRQQMPK